MILYKLEKSATLNWGEGIRSACSSDLLYPFCDKGFAARIVVSWTLLSGAW